MHLRSFVIPTAVALAAAVGLPATAQAAPAQCSLVLPAKVVVDSTSETIPSRLSSNCTSSDATTASWHVVHTGGANDWWLEWTLPGVNGGVLPSTLATGTYRAYPGGAEQADGDPLTQNTPETVVKLGARVSLSGRYVQRPLIMYGSTVGSFSELALTASATTWSATTRGWYPRAGAQVQLLRHKSGDWWVWERNGTTNSQGEVTFRLPSYSSAIYRVRIVETAKAWASGSGTFRATPQ